MVLRCAPKPGGLSNQCWLDGGRRSWDLERTRCHRFGRQLSMQRVRHRLLKERMRMRMRGRTLPCQHVRPWRFPWAWSWCCWFQPNGTSWGDSCWRRHILGWPFSSHRRGKRKRGNAYSKENRRSWSPDPTSYVPPNPERSRRGVAELMTSMHVDIVIKISTLEARNRYNWTAMIEKEWYLIRTTRTIIHIFTIALLTHTHTHIST